jgi:hypothetical protein
MLFFDAVGVPFDSFGDLCVSKAILTMDFSEVDMFL